MAQPSPTPEVPYAGVEYSDATGWAAWVFLGAIMLMILGALQVGVGLVALFRPEVLAASRADLLLPIGLTALAWAHVAVGALAVVTGVGLMRGRTWARVVAIVLAGAAALVNFAFLDVYPVWSATAIVLTTVVIYAVAAHGAEMADAYAGS
jgi:hypothetical protein